MYQLLLKILKSEGDEGPCSCFQFILVYHVVKQLAFWPNILLPKKNFSQDFWLIKMQQGNVILLSRNYVRFCKATTTQNFVLHFIFYSNSLNKLKKGKHPSKISNNILYFNTFSLALQFTRMIVSKSDSQKSHTKTMFNFGWYISDAILLK